MNNCLICKMGHRPSIRTYPSLVLIQKAFERDGKVIKVGDVQEVSTTNPQIIRAAQEAHPNPVIMLVPEEILQCN